MKLSIIISSHNRSNLFRRCLYWINRNRPSCKFEVIVADDNSTEREEILIQLNRYNFPWRFVEVDKNKWEESTKLKIYAGNPALTNNIGFLNSTGELISLVGNECIVYHDYDDLIKEFEEKNNENSVLFTTTYDINLNLNDDGSDLNQLLSPKDFHKPLASQNLHTDVTNYCSLTTAKVWEQIGGYDEIYLQGIACEDSDWVRRAALLPNFLKIRSELISFHQSHGGKTMYDEPLDIEYSKKFYRGLLINREIYNKWDGKRIRPIMCYENIQYTNCIRNVIIKNYGT